MHSYVGFVQAEGKLIGSISLLEVERIDSVGNDELVAAICCRNQLVILGLGVGRCISAFISSLLW